MSTNVVSISSSAVVYQVLKWDNYASWSVCMKNNLLDHDLWDIIEATVEPPKEEENQEEFEAWRMKNAQALHAIQISCEPEVFLLFRDISSAKEAWDNIATYFGCLAVAKPKKNRDNPETNNVNIRYRTLHEAIIRGNLDDVKKHLRGDPQAVRAKLTACGCIALHIASRAGEVEIVEELVEVMSNEALAIQNSFGQTALFDAAGIGNIRIAKCLIKMNDQLASMSDRKGIIPVIIACKLGHKEMTRYLYRLTPLQLLLPENGINGSLLLQHCISGEMLDIALHILQKCPRLAFTEHSVHLLHLPLHQLASHARLFLSGSLFVFWQRCIYSCVYVQKPTPDDHASSNDNHFIINIRDSRTHQVNILQHGIKQIYDMKWTHTYALEIVKCIAKQTSEIEEIQLRGKGVLDAFFIAIQNGVVEIVNELIKVCPSLLHSFEENGRDIFLTAVQYRQEKIFSLIYEVEGRKYVAMSITDVYGNNILHMAAMLAPRRRFSSISGAALQMQRELQWYQEVKNSMNPKLERDHNKAFVTPKEMFVESHKELVKEGEIWMKQTASSYTVVGALIITVMFAAAFTVPGGNNQETGYPIFLRRKSFMFFIISDAISLFASSTSVLMFLGILTSRYSEWDFLYSLPTKLIIGLSALFISLAAMMVAFCAALVLMLKDRLNIIIPITCLASIPVMLFFLLQFPLLKEIFISTHGRGIFDKKKKKKKKKKN